MGTGHVMRCLTLAKILKDRGGKVEFICRKHYGNLIDKIRLNGFMVYELELSSKFSLDKQTSYSSWLGDTQENDAYECIQILKSKKTDWLIVDHYALNQEWQSNLKSCYKRIMVIDDLADRRHDCDLLLDQNFFGEATYQRYLDLVPPQCRQLLGPHYALLGPEYAQLHPLVPPRTELRRVLVFFGGVDPSNLTSRALEALMDPALEHIAVDVVLGRQSPHHKLVEDLVAQRPFTTLHGPLPSLAGLIARADLAIGAGGTTTWERACLGLPSLVVAIAANQLPFAQALDQAGHLQFLGDRATVVAQQIRFALLTRIAKPFTELPINKLTDGWGASRLAIAMLGAQGAINLRPATEADEALLLQWANDSQVRTNSFSPELIAPANHK